MRWCGPGMTVVSACSSLPNCDGDSSTFEGQLCGSVKGAISGGLAYSLFRLAFLSLSAS